MALRPDATFPADGNFLVAKLGGFRRHSTRKTEKHCGFLSLHDNLRVRSATRLHQPTRQRRNVVLLIPVLLLALAVALEFGIYPDRTVELSSSRAAALWCCRSVLFALCVYFVVWRPRVTLVHLTAFFLFGLFTAVVGTLFLQFIYVPPPVISGWRSPAPPTERNELGFRGRSIRYSSEDRVIVLLGDSQAESQALPFEAMPERLLESYLNSAGGRTRVFTIGTYGYGQDQELLALTEYYRRYRADLVALWETPVNDVWNNMFNTHMPHRSPKPTFWLEGDVLRGPTESLEQHVGDSPFVMMAIWNRIFVLPRREIDWERRLPRPYSPLTHYSGPVNTEWQKRWDTNLGRMRDENLATEKSHMELMLTPPSKRTEYGLRLTHALLGRIRDLVTSKHGKFVVFQEDVPSSEPENEQIYVLNGKYYRASKKQIKADWSYINQGFDTEIIPVALKNWRVSAADGHLNRPATEFVMRTLAERLLPRLTKAEPQRFKGS